MPDPTPAADAGALSWATDQTTLTDHFDAVSADLPMERVAATVDIGAGPTLRRQRTGQLGSWQSPEPSWEDRSVRLGVTACAQ